MINFYLYSTFTAAEFTKCFNNQTKAGDSGGKRDRINTQGELKWEGRKEIVETKKKDNVSHYKKKW